MNLSESAAYDLMACLLNNPQDFTFDEIEDILAIVEGENDSRSWWWLLRLKNMRTAILTGSCDYTGSSDFPVVVVNNLPDGTLCDPKLFCQRSLRDSSNFIARTNLSNLIFRQFCHAVKTTAQRCTTSLSGHILHIGYMCSQKQMFWPNTLWFVTSMANFHTVWNSANKNFVREAMCTNMLPMKIKYSVPTIVSCTKPYPAVISLFNTAPEEFDTCHTMSHRDNIPQASVLAQHWITDSLFGEVR